MPTAEAHLATDRASRYLAQLCQHANHMGQHHWPRARGGAHAPPIVEHVESSGTDGLIRFGSGQCVLHATPDALTVRVEATDEDSLRRLQERIAHRLETIGRRDQLKVTWHQPAAPPAQPGEATSVAPMPDPGSGTRRRHRKTITIAGLTAAVALVVAVHTGLVGGAMATADWKNWGVGVILAVVAVKVLLLGAHVLAGVLGVRFAKHRGLAGYILRRWRRRADSAAAAARDQLDVPHREG
jgi:hypothetical protein